MLAAMVSISGLELTLAEKHFLAAHNPIGVTLFARNIKDKTQLKKLVSGIKESIGRDDVMVAVDQEGGRVRRLPEPEFLAEASQYVLGKLPPEVSKYHAIMIAKDLHSVGINMNYAPVLDVVYQSTHPVLASRCFSADEKVVAKLGGIMIDEYCKHAVSPCMKHLPGHGRAKSDPHLGMPILTNSLAELAKDFYPFGQNHNCPMGMTAHIAVTEVDSRNPVTMSAKAIDRIIRGMIGFEGFLISDAIDMQALKGTIGERALASVTAGCDVVCYCGGKIDELSDLADKCPKLSDKSLMRFEKVRDIVKQKDIVFEDVADKYYDMVGTVAEYNETYDATETLNIMNKGV